MEKKYGAHCAPLQGKAGRLPALRTRADVGIGPYGALP